MARQQQSTEVEHFYQTHPINVHQILDKLKSESVDLATLSEDTLQAHDQDHFGGVEANDTLASGAGIEKETTVLDVCCGLGGPSRYLAHNYGCRVTGIDLSEDRIAGAEKLTALTGLDDHVSFKCANALDLPFVEGAFDVVISQEAFCHIPDKERLVRECARVLKSGGRIAFTDILATSITTEETSERLGREMALCELGSFSQYQSLLKVAGCSDNRHDDLGRQWSEILIDRLAMYRNLKGQTIDRFGSEHFEKWDSAYSFFVAQFTTGELSGGRFVARKNTV